MNVLTKLNSNHLKLCACFACYIKPWGRYSCEEWKKRRLNYSAICRYCGVFGGSHLAASQDDTSGSCRLSYLQNKNIVNDFSEKKFPRWSDVYSYYPDEK